MVDSSYIVDFTKIHNYYLITNITRNNLIKSNRCYIESYKQLNFREFKMKLQLIIILLSSFLLFSCGTVNGALNGTSSILEGIATDTRRLVSVFNY